MVKIKSSVQKQLKTWLSNAERVVLAGVGNPIRMDDYAGLRVVQDLQGNVSERVLLIECETVPEDSMQQIIDFCPTHVLLIDAALLGLKPGSYKLVEPERLTMPPAFSTHMLPLRIFCEHIRKTTQARIALLLVEPERSDFGEGLTPSVEASVKEIVQTLHELLPQ
ncbi:MAG TPA: hydrogenase 3 maturation endopeptidase HyCI [candidate division Zixibacteria bacterium]|nr:hydrogenase 3 maturation endopeptidase HyCI [candidate division Zixibacteria bacterium]